jgi:hypothetical protein
LEYLCAYLKYSYFIFFILFFSPIFIMMVKIDCYSQQIETIFLIFIFYLFINFGFSFLRDMHFEEDKLISKSSFLIKKWVIAFG